MTKFLSWKSLKIPECYKWGHSLWHVSQFAQWLLFSCLVVYLWSRQCAGQSSDCAFVTERGHALRDIVYCTFFSGSQSLSLSLSLLCPL